MNVNSGDNLADKIKKENFQLKPVTKDGLILQIHHTVPNNLYHKRIRFLHASFDHSGLILATADIEGNIFITDFSCTKYWAITKLPVCSTLAFNLLNSNELIVASKDGLLRIINIHLGTILATLEGHLKSVINISFAQEQCLTASANQAIIYNINTFEKLHELCINSDAKIKQMFFMPVTHHILACFADDYIHVWKNDSFESFKKLMPSEWNKFAIKSIAITRNGTMMVIGGLSSKLIVFSLDTWVLTRILSLSDEVNVKKLDFVSQVHDGGANKFIIILTTNGIIHLLNMEESAVIAKIHKDSEIISFACSSNGTHLACILRSGEVNIHKIALFISNSLSESNGEPAELSSKSSKLKLFIPSLKPCEQLNLSRLQDILMEYGEYPENYRTLIWTKILMLPSNKNNYAAICRKGINPAFANIEGMYPLTNKIALKNFKRVLSNLANWSAAICSMEFVPLFVFPFVKIFENDPVLCFEAVVTIIINWCQHWFEYAPVAPVNVLAMIENVFRDHDPELLTILTEKNVTSEVYAWSLLETGFSEILTIKEWCILWDHILSNDASFILMIPVAYNIINRTVLAQIDSVDKFQLFYRSQNAIVFKRFISKIYFLKKYTRNVIHPNQYLNHFKPLIKDCYPLFEDGPKAIATDSLKGTSQTKSQFGDARLAHGTKSFTLNVKQFTPHSSKDTNACGDKAPIKKLFSKSTTSKKSSINEPPKTSFVKEENTRLRGGVEKTTFGCTYVPNDTPTEDMHCPYSSFDDKDLNAIEREICKVQEDICKFKSKESQKKDVMALKKEEANRIKMLESLLQKRLLNEKIVADQRKLELSNLRTRLYDMQADSMVKTHRRMESISLAERKRELDNILQEINYLQQQDELDMQQTEEELSRHYVELLKQKTALENVLLQSVEDDEKLNENYSVIDEQRKTINNELEQLRKAICVARTNAKLNYSCKMTVEQDKINKAYVAVAREMAHKQRQVAVCNSNVQLLKMEQNTKSLEGEVEQLLDQFSVHNKQKYKSEITKVKESLTSRRRLINKELELTCLRNIKLGECHDNKCENCCTANHQS